MTPTASPSPLDRVTRADGLPRLGTGGPSVEEVLTRLERNEPAGAFGLSGRDLVAALAFEALDGEGPSLVQADPRRPGLAPSLAEDALAPLFPKATRAQRLGLSAGLLQVLDFWDASHDAAQRADDLGERDVSAYWHAIAHRREPDPGNASYWFRRVGRHPLLERLGDDARALLGPDVPPPFTGVVSARGFDPFGFIPLCDPRKGPTAQVARQLQRREMLLLLEASLPA